MIYSTVFLKSASLGSELLVLTWKRIAKDIYTPCLTKSTESVSNGHIISIAYLLSFDPMARAITHPYLINGL